jgi:hypothetical protein
MTLQTRPPKIVIAFINELSSARGGSSAAAATKSRVKPAAETIGVS